MRRPQDEINMAQLEEKLIGISEKVQFIPTPLIEISSQEIRARIREKRPFRYFLPEAVYHYILENKLYRD
jgi:nicotinate-nucleotide adenylyltransferase